jgi:hypothetical protein
MVDVVGGARVLAFGGGREPRFGEPQEKRNESMNHTSSFRSLVGARFSAGRAGPVLLGEKLPSQAELAHLADAREADQEAVVAMTSSSAPLTQQPSHSEEQSQSHKNNNNNSTSDLRLTGVFACGGDGTLQSAQHGDAAGSGGEFVLVALFEEQLVGGPDGPVYRLSVEDTTEAGPDVDGVFESFLERVIPDFLDRYDDIVDGWMLSGLQYRDGTSVPAPGATPPKRKPTPDRRPSQAQAPTERGTTPRPIKRHKKEDSEDSADPSPCVLKSDPQLAFDKFVGRRALTVVAACAVYLRAFPRALIGFSELWAAVHDTHQLCAASAAKTPASNLRKMLQAQSSEFELVDRRVRLRAAAESESVTWSSLLEETTKPAAPGATARAAVHVAPAEESVSVSAAELDSHPVSRSPSSAQQRRRSQFAEMRDVVFDDPDRDSRNRTKRHAMIAKLQTPPDALGRSGRRLRPLSRCAAGLVCPKCDAVLTTAECAVSHLVAGHGVEAVGGIEEQFARTGRFEPFGPSADHAVPALDGVQTRPGAKCPLCAHCIPLRDQGGARIDREGCPRHGSSSTVPCRVQSVVVAGGSDGTGIQTLCVWVEEEEPGASAASVLSAEFPSPSLLELHARATCDSEGESVRADEGSFVGRAEGSLVHESSFVEKAEETSAKNAERRTPRVGSESSQEATTEPRVSDTARSGVVSNRRDGGGGNKRQSTFTAAVEPSESRPVKPENEKKLLVLLRSQAMPHNPVRRNLVVDKNDDIFTALIRHPDIPTPIKRALECGACQILDHPGRRPVNRLVSICHSLPPGAAVTIRDTS